MYIHLEEYWQNPFFLGCSVFLNPILKNMMNQLNLLLTLLPYFFRGVLYAEKVVINFVTACIKHPPFIWNCVIYRLLAILDFRNLAVRVRKKRKKCWKTFISRPGLVYKHCCHYLIKQIHEWPFVLSWLYGTAKPKRLMMVLPVIKKDYVAQVYQWYKSCSDLAKRVDFAHC